MYCQGITDLLHYLDDFLFLGAPDSPACGSHLAQALSLCEALGFPVALEKIGGPSTTITFLGIEIDSALQVLRLPPTKLNRLKALLASWLNKRAATKQELQSIIGHLNHAATVVRPGRAFTRGLIEASKLPKLPSQWVRLDAVCRADIAWWQVFLETWNGTSMMPPPHHSTVCTSDASGAWGCGAVTGNQWFQLPWAGTVSPTSPTPGVITSSPSHRPTINSIAVKEMIPVVISAAIWGHNWTGKQVLFRCDNMSVVSVLNHWSSKDVHLSHLSRCLFFFAAYHKFTFTAEHIAGELNTLADALSRNKLPLFLNLFPQADHTPSPIPRTLVALLLDHPVEWTSPVWRKRFRDSLSKGSLPPPGGHTSPP